MKLKPQMMKTYRTIEADAIMPQREAGIDAEQNLRAERVHQTLEQRAQASGGKLNLSEEIDWGEPMGDEVW